MAILDTNEYDLMQLWGIITQLGEQLSQNQSMSVSLYTTAAKIKNQAINLQTGFVLRKFNLDKTQEEYDSQLEQMTAAINAENHDLQHDNKQLSTLIKEYEQTLETLMSNFRNRAQHVQEHELSLIREFESKLLAREEENANVDLQANSAVSESIARISNFLRQLLRAESGESSEPPRNQIDDEEDQDPWTATHAADYALEREIELARLEKENEELRRMLGLIPPQPRRDNSEFRSPHENIRSEPARVPTVHKPSGVINSGFAQYQKTDSPG